MKKRDEGQVSSDLLQMWMDGEVGKRSAEVRDYVDNSPAASRELVEWRRSADELRDLVDRGIGEVEPLEALRAIRARVEDRQRRSVVGRVTSWWNELWMFERRRVGGVIAATAVGALCAPALVWWIGTTSAPTQPAMAAVVVESLEVGNDAKAVVYEGGNGTTTLIWVEPTGAAER